MKFSLILACTAGMVGALLVEDGFWSSEPILQARSPNEFLRLPRTLPLQHQGYVDLLPRSYALVRRTDRPRAHSPRRQAGQGISRPVGPQENGPLTGSVPHGFADAVPARSGSPTIRASVMAQGKAALTVGPLEAPRGRLDVPHGEIGSMRDEHSRHTSVSAKSQQSPPREGQRPGRQTLQASAKGRSVIGTVEPGQGGFGRIRIETPDGVKDYPVTDPRGKYKVGGSTIAGGSRVTATSFHGGRVNALGTDVETAPPPRGS